MTEARLTLPISPDTPLCITVSISIDYIRVKYLLTSPAAISEGHGDTALLLLRAGAEADKKDVDGHLAIDLAPDTKVCLLLDILVADDLTSSR